jgi:hypothetical protein
MAVQRGVRSTIPQILFGPPLTVVLSRLQGVEPAG